MFQEAFKKLELDELATVLDQINPHLDGSDFDPVDTTALGLELSFYPGYRFLDLADYSTMPGKRRFVLFKDGGTPEKSDVIVLDWTNEPIYLLNHNLPISLNKDNVSEYIRFFFTYVRGKHGRFIVTENVDDINWKEDPPPQARKAIAKMLVPLEVLDEKNGAYYLKSTMMFRDSLFKADIEVKPNGLVTLMNEELLVEDMPVLDDTFGQ
ncbi:MAG: hypothetical protein ACLFR0_01990 [Alphaproteobacteria bacterium]